MFLDLNTATKEEFANTLVLAAISSNDYDSFYLPREKEILKLDFEKNEMFQAFEKWLEQNSK